LAACWGVRARTLSGMGTSGALLPSVALERLPDA
jgi:hypothetical protein